MFSLLSKLGFQLCVTVTPSWLFCGVLCCCLFIVPSGNVYCTLHSIEGFFLAKKSCFSDNNEILSTPRLVFLCFCTLARGIVQTWQPRYNLGGQPSLGLRWFTLFDCRSRELKYCNLPSLGSASPFVPWSTTLIVVVKRTVFVGLHNPYLTTAFPPEN